MSAPKPPPKNITNRTRKKSVNPVLAIANADLLENPTVANPLTVASKLMSELRKLAKFDSEEERKLIVSRLREEFLTKRVESASLAETLKSKVTASLINLVESGDIPIPRLLQIYKEYSEGSAVDLAALTGQPLPGSGKGMPGIQINLGDTNKSGSHQSVPITHENNQMMGASQILEAIGIMASEINKNDEDENKIVDITEEEDLSNGSQ